MKVVPPPGHIFSPTTRVMFVFAHQDDEAACAGLIQRVSPFSRFLWVTNGDGLADLAGMERREYAEARRLETTAAMHCLGISSDRLRFLGHSEVEIYRSLLRVAMDPQNRHEVFQSFRAIASQVAAEIMAFRPEVVFTVAWQGGHPEHDLVHFFTYLAVRDQKGVQLFEVPQYELGFTVLLRFPPWYPLPVHEIRLSKSEVEQKKRALRVYATQEELLGKLGKVLEVSRLFQTLKTFGRDPVHPIGREFFAEVPLTRDYTRSPHRLDLLEYIGDECDGQRISFHTMILPIVQALL